MEEQKVKALKTVKDKINKDFGKGSIMTLSEKPDMDMSNVISTGSIGLNFALGVGGLPKGRITEIYGPESCISGESFLNYEVWEKGKRINHKGGSIRRLYERFKGIDDGEPKQGRHLQKNNVEYYVKSVNHENCIVRNQVLDVVKTGIKKCYELTTVDGQKIISTVEHKFMTPEGFLPLEKLEIGNSVFIHNNTRIKGKQKYEGRPSVLVKYHPKLPIKIVDNKYLYYRGQVSRLMYEAHLNNVSYKQYITYLNTLSKEKIDQFNFLPDNIHVHHEDEDFFNNDIDNLRLISPQEHGKLHAKDRSKNLSFIAVTTEILSITEIGEIETYDLKCAYPYNNYIANDFVVHNSGKTTVAIHVIAEAQKKGGLCAFIDVEHAFDKEYAKNLGVNIDELEISQPDYGEQALEIADRLVTSGVFDVIVIDSVAALVPKGELDGEMGDNKMGLHARLMSQACRKLTASISKTNTLVIFINQLREKIGVMFGSPEVTTGGNALKFYASVRLDIRRSTTEANSTKNAEGVKMGNLTTVKVIKNKVAPPFRSCQFNIIYGKGIDKKSEILEIATDMEVINKAGSWYSYKDNKIGQGREEVFKLLADNPDMYEEIKNIVESKLIESLEKKENGDTI